MSKRSTLLASSARSPFAHLEPRRHRAEKKDGARSEDEDDDEKEGKRSRKAGRAADEDEEEDDEKEGKRSRTAKRAADDDEDETDDDEKEGKRSWKAKRAADEDEEEDDGDDETDAEDESDDEKASARARERGRCAAIFRCAAAGRNPAAAATLAFTTRLTRREAIRTLAALDAGRPEPARAESLRDRMAPNALQPRSPDAGSSAGRPGDRMLRALGKRAHQPGE